MGVFISYIQLFGQDQGRRKIVFTRTVVLPGGVKSEREAKECFSLTVTFKLGKKGSEWESGKRAGSMDWEFSEVED